MVEKEHESFWVESGRLLLVIFGIATAIILIIAGKQMLGIWDAVERWEAGYEMISYYRALGLGFIGFGVLAGGLSIGLALLSNKKKT